MSLNEHNNELEILLLFEEMQELNFFLDNPEKMNTFASLQRGYEESQLLQEINQEDDIRKY